METYDQSLGEFVTQVDGNKRDTYLTLYIPLGFWMVGGAASLVGGYLADTINRRNALCATVFVGETACGMTYFTTNFWGLFVTRIITGVSIGAANPLLYSLIGDIFPKEERGRAIALSVVAINAGTAPLNALTPVCALCRFVCASD
jgi:MFS family permease